MAIFQILSITPNDDGGFNVIVQIAGQENAASINVPPGWLNFPNINILVEQYLESLGGN